jgi:hypothetical protein
VTATSSRSPWATGETHGIRRLALRLTVPVPKAVWNTTKPDEVWYCYSDSMKFS